MGVVSTHAVLLLIQRLSWLPPLQVLLLLDVDFMISSSLNLPQHTAWIYDMVSSGVLVVLPALEPVHSDEAAQQAVIRTCTGQHDRQLNHDSSSLPSLQYTHAHKHGAQRQIK